MEEMLEVLKFACELSSDAAYATFSHLQMIGDKEGLTAYNFAEKSSVEDFSYDQKGLYLSVRIACFAVQRQTDKLCSLFFFSVLIML